MPVTESTNLRYIKVDLLLEKAAPLNIFQPLSLTRSICHALYNWKLCSIVHGGGDAREFPSESL